MFDYMCKKSEIWRRKRERERILEFKGEVIGLDRLPKSNNEDLYRYLMCLLQLLKSFNSEGKINFVPQKIAKKFKNLSWKAAKAISYLKFQNGIRLEYEEYPIWIYDKYSAKPRRIDRNKVNLIEGNVDKMLTLCDKMIKIL